MTGARPGGTSSAVRDPLMALIGEPLDPGYAAAAQRQARTGRREGQAGTVLAAAGAFVIGLILVVAYSYEQRSAPRRAALHDELVSQAQHAQAVNDDLEASARRLSERVRELRDAANPAGPAAAAELEALEISAGARAVHGPGVSVTLADVAGTAGPGSGGGRSGVPGAFPAGRIGDRELRSVVNALWAGGAEAIAINGVRLTATSAIRYAGQVVLVDFRSITSPYRVEAVGDSEGLTVSFTDSAVASALRTLDAVGALQFDFASVSSASLPAAVVGEPRFAQPVDELPAPVPSESPS